MIIALAVFTCIRPTQCHASLAILPKQSGAAGSVVTVVYLGLVNLGAVSVQLWVMDWWIGTDSYIYFLELTIINCTQ